jgi:hypothetical protein
VVLFDTHANVYISMYVSICTSIHKNVYKCIVVTCSHYC